MLPTDRFDVDEAFRLIERHRVTNLFTVPTILKMLVEHPAVDKYDHSSLRYVIYAGAPMYRADQKVALAKLGKVLVQYFGLGEVTGNITVLPTRNHHIEDGPEPARAPAGSSAPACRSRSRTSKAASCRREKPGRSALSGRGICRLLQ